VEHLSIIYKSLFHFSTPSVPPFVCPITIYQFWFRDIELNLALMIDWFLVDLWRLHRLKHCYTTAKVFTPIIGKNEKPNKYIYIYMVLCKIQKMCYCRLVSKTFPLPDQITTFNPINRIRSSHCVETLKN
jgi:hypothetical protein